jgi:hypothetical protein
MVMRLAELELIREDEKRNLFIQISRKQWRKREPLDDELKTEEPKFLKRSIDLLLEKGMTCAEEMVLATKPERHREAPRTESRVSE